MERLQSIKSKPIDIDNYELYNGYDEITAITNECNRTFLVPNDKFTI